MFSRTKEFLLILALVAVITMILSRKGTREVESTPTPVSTPSAVATPAAYTSPSPEGSTLLTLSDLQPLPVPDRETLLADYELGEGLDGYEEVRKLEPAPLQPTTLQSGQELFRVNCAMCHGNGLDGSGEGGKALDPPPANLLMPDTYKYGKHHLSIYRTVAYGIEGTGMAPWGDILEPQEIWDITHYIVAYRATYQSR